ncbi:MAG: hypothetical protein EXS14_00940 [Planctomycetes bacterium]|nr:hypothetical protein [Planctomycetota bacterium]
MLRITLAVMALVTTLLADDVTLKNGTVHKDLTLLKETPKSFEFVTLDGRKLTLSKDAIAERIAKPTALDEFKLHRRRLDLKNKDAVLELAMWAKEKAIAREATALFEQVLKLDGENAVARNSLGFRKLEGKWVTEAEAAKADAVKQEASYKVRGWKKVKEKWHRPIDAFRIEKDMVQVDGRWVLPAQKKKIDDGKLQHANGEWLIPEDKAKYDQGLRKQLNKWVPLTDLDAVHTEFTDPWNLRTDHIQLLTTVRHERAQKILAVAEDIYAGIAAVLGEHPDLHDKRGRLLLLVGRGVKSYQQLGGAFGASDREAEHSSGYGVFFSAKAGGVAGGASASYDNDDDDWMRVWVGHGIAHSFLDRFKTEEMLDERLVEAFAGYASGLHAGSWQPTWWQWARWLKDSPMPEAGRILYAATYRDDKSLAASGFFLHFLQKKNPVAFAEFWQMFAMGRGNAAELMTTTAGADGKLDMKALDAEYQEFFQKTRAAFRPWDK